MNLEQWRASLDAEPSRILLDGKAVRLHIPGAPRTKKNSPVLFRGITNPFLRDTFLRFVEAVGYGNLTAERLDEWLAKVRLDWPRPRLLPSEAYREWHAKAVAAVLPKIMPLAPYFPINYPVHVMALVYRERDAGDYLGYAQALGDFLQDIGVLDNDVLIRSWDGTRLLKDAEKPHVDLWISAYSQEGDSGLFQRSHKEWAQHREPEPETIQPVDEEPTARQRITSIYSSSKRGQEVAGNGDH